MTPVSINIPAVRGLIGGAEAATAVIVDVTGRMRSTMDGVMVDSTTTRTADPVPAWLQESLPDLRRRLEMARLHRGLEAHVHDRGGDLRRGGRHHPPPGRGCG